MLRFSMWSSCWLALCAVASAEAVLVGPHQFTIPDGYELSVAAAPELVARPIAVARDEQGAMYVTDSAGMSDRAEKQLELKPHRVRKLIDTDGDGVYDESTLFADGLMFPEGCLWYEGSLYVAAPPQIWKLTDTDGDGACDKREVWFDGKTLTGCGNDLHGPYLGPDGWFYWCKGAFAEQSYTINGKPFTTRSSHIFRARPDGSRMEPVLTGGMDNPVNVAWIPNGDRFLSCTFFQHPENGRRDGLIHSIYGGVYGKKHDSIYEHPMTGDVMPVLVHMGAAAPCGLIGSSGYTFGEKTSDDRLFACYFNLHKVVEHTLIPDGPTYTTKERDLVACDHPDFHPTDVYEDADGSLLIVDTGGWYKVCCPTSQLAKPDVLGGIYRLRKKDQPPVNDPLGLKSSWEGIDNLVYNLLDPYQHRPWVQQRAARELRQQGPAAVEALLKLSDFEEHTGRGEAHALIMWVLAGMDCPEAHAGIRSLLEWETFEDAQLAGWQAVALWRDTEALPLAWTVLQNPEADPRVRRAVLETVGRIGQVEAVPHSAKLLETLPVLTADQLDETGAPLAAATRIEEHAAIYALIELGDEAAVRQLLRSHSPRLRRAALVALDQMPNGNLEPSEVIPRLSSNDEMLRRTATWIVGHHAEWGPQLVETFRAQLAQVSEDEPAQAALAAQLGRLATSTEIQSLLLDTWQGEHREARQVALRAMTLSGLSALPQTWLEGMVAELPKLDQELLSVAVNEIRQWPLPKERPPALMTALRRVGENGQLDDSVRLTALSIASPLGEIEAPLFAWLLQLGSSDPQLGLRSDVAKVLGQAKLTRDQQTQLLPLLATWGPFEVPALLPVFAEGDAELGEQLLAVLDNSPGFRGLRVDLLRQLVAKYPDSVQTAAVPLMKKLNASVAEQTAQLEQLLANLPEGDVRRGHQLFHSQQAKCITCHQRAYHGGRLGPDLTNIGQVRTNRDILEAMLFPSASLVRGYEPVTVALTDGRVLTGIVKAEDRESVTLALEAEKQQRVLRTDIEEILPSPVSLMPQGLDKILTAQDFADLIAFLKQ